MIIIDKDIYYAHDLARSLSYSLKYNTFYYFENYNEFLNFEKSIEIKNPYDKIIICNKLNDVYYSQVDRFKYIFLYSNVPLLNGYSTRVKQYNRDINTRSTKNICFKFDSIDKLTKRINALVKIENEIILDVGNIYLVWHARTTFKSKDNISSLIIKSLKEKNKECIYVPFNSLLDIDPVLLPRKDSNNTLDTYLNHNIELDYEGLMSFLQKNGRNSLGALTFKPQYHLEDYFIFDEKILKKLFDIFYELAKDYKINIVIDLHTILASKFKDLFKYVSRLYFYPIDDPRLETAWKIEFNKISTYIDKTKIMSSLDITKFKDIKFSVKKVS